MDNPLKKKHLLEFEFEFSDAQVVPENPQFSYGKAKILYKGLNRNNSHITPESVKKALPTLFGIPIVGEYIEETDNFGSHGGKIEVTDKGVKFIDTTTPFGYVSENSNVYWETVQELNGQTRDYFVADRCVFWTGRYPQLNTLFKHGKFNQSMEIDVNEGSFAIMDGKETFRIDDFTFSALCILGIATEDDPEGHVEPCFENASIEIYNNEQNNFQLKFNQMITEFNSNQEGGQPVADKVENQEVEVTEPTETPVEPEVESTVDPEDIEKETPVEPEDTPVEPENKEEVPAEQPKEEFQEQVEEQPVDTPVDPAPATDEFAVLSEKLLTEQAVNKSLAEKLVVEQNKYSALEEEVKELREFKRNTELTSLAEKFSGKLENDILKATIEANSEKSIEELESLIFAEIGKQNFSQKAPKEKEMFSMGVAETEKQEKDPYNGLFDLYGKSK